MWALFLAGLILFEIVADIFVKEHSIKHTAWTFAAGLSGYIIANVCWLISMRYRSHLAIGACIFSVSTGIIATVIGKMYNEVITTRHWIGIVLGIVSLAFLF